jgi:hypothetical protein
VMSHIQKRADRRYRARWLDPDGRERYRTFTRKADAERHLAAVEGAKLSGAYVNDANPVTVGEYARKWATNRPHRQTTARHHYASVLLAAGESVGPDAAGHRHRLVDE